MQSRNAPGYRDRLIRRSRYDLVLSNILARPLAVMAADLARRLAPDGRAVLSGLLRRQEPIVLAPHRGCGIVLDHRLVIDGWSTLVMRRRHGSEMKTGAEAPIFRNRLGRKTAQASFGRASFSGFTKGTGAEDGLGTR